MGDLIDLKRKCKNDIAKLFPVVPMTGYGHKPKHRKILLNIRKPFSPLRVNDHRNRFPREVVESQDLKRSSQSVWTSLVLGKWL